MPEPGIAFGDIPAGCLCAWTGAADGGWALGMPSWYGLLREPREYCPVLAGGHRPPVNGVAVHPP